MREPQQLALLPATEHTASVVYPALPSKLNLLRTGRVGRHSAAAGEIGLHSKGALLSLATV